MVFLYSYYSNIMLTMLLVVGTTQLLVVDSFNVPQQRPTSRLLMANKIEIIDNDKTDVPETIMHGLPEYYYSYINNDDSIMSGFFNNRQSTLIEHHQERSILFIGAVAATATLVLTGVILTPLPCQAIDHPGIDLQLLNIPTPIPDIRYFVAGGCCAAASHGITTPVDVVKTKMQADKSLKEVGLVQATRDVIAKDGPGELLQGLGPTIVGYGFEGALKFGIYESFKPFFLTLLHTSDVTIPYLLASVSAGAVAAIVLCPMEQLRIRSVTDSDFDGDVISLINENGGFLSLFSGLNAMLSKQVPYTFGKQCTFDQFATLLYSILGSSDSTNMGLTPVEIKYGVSIGAAFLASMVACVLSHPGDVILTATYKKSNKQQQQQQKESSSNSFQNTVSTILAEQGIEGFFSGISARFVHVGIIITSQLVLYDLIKQGLGLPATGSH